MNINENSSRRINQYICLLMVIIVTVISFLPIIYCSFFNYATGDDFHQSNLTHLVVVNHGTIKEFFAGMLERFYSFYYGWGGNWSATLMWSLQPGIWGEKYYHITFYLSAIFLYGGIGSLSYYWYRKYISKDNIYFWIMYLLLIVVTTQGMPNGNTAYFWYAVFANYIIPFGLMLGTVVWLNKYIEKMQYRYIVFSSLALIYIGGAGYMSLVVSFEILVLMLVYVFCSKQSVKKRIVLLIPLISFSISAFYNIKAPGNYARGGELLEISVGRIIVVILKSIYRGIEYIGQYIIYCRLLLLFVPLIVLFSYLAINTDTFNVRFAFLKIIIGFLIYCSSFAPMVLMNDIYGSSGHTNTYWLLFMLWITYSIICIVGTIKCKSYNLIDKGMYYYRFVCILLVLLSLIMYRHFIGNMYAYKCYDYISSGQLADYEAQMQERFLLLNDPDKEDIIVPYMNDQQGPFLHMAITNDVNDFTNEVTAAFYGKNSVLGVPREEYYEKYANQ